MTRIRLAGESHGQTAREIRIPGFEISWAGEYPFDHKLCLGSYDGALIFTTMEGDSPTRPFPVSKGSQSVNGVAFLAGSMAVSTPSEVTFLGLTATGTAARGRCVYDGGAHDVVATSSGYFVAPLGLEGLLLMKPDTDEYQRMSRSCVQEQAFYFYKVAALGASPSGDVLVCAVRGDGFATVVRDKSSSRFAFYSAPGIDVIDVCSLRSERSPFAAALLGIDGWLHLIGDVLDPHQVHSLRLDRLQGSAYRILCALGHILILTSKSLYFFENLATKSLRAGQGSGPVPFRCIDMEAVDISLASSHELFGFMPDGSIWRRAIEDLATSGVDCSQDAAELIGVSGWESRACYEMTEVPLAA